MPVEAAAAKAYAAWSREKRGSGLEIPDWMIQKTGGFVWLCI